MDEGKHKKLWLGGFAGWVVFGATPTLASFLWVGQADDVSYLGAIGACGKAYLGQLATVSATEVPSMSRTPIVQTVLQWKPFVEWVVSLLWLFCMVAFNGRLESVALRLRWDKALELLPSTRPTLMLFNSVAWNSLKPTTLILWVGLPWLSHPAKRPHLIFLSTSGGSLIFKRGLWRGVAVSSIQCSMVGSSARCLR